jgi:hypothetical protein
MTGCHLRNSTEARTKRMLHNGPALLSASHPVVSSGAQGLNTLS